MLERVSAWTDFMRLRPLLPQSYSAELEVMQIRDELKGRTFVAGRSLFAEGCEKYKSGTNDVLRFLLNFFVPKIHRKLYSYF